MKKRLIIIFLLILILFIIIFFKVRSLFRLELVYKNNAGVPYEWQYEIEDKSIVKLDKCYVVKDENKIEKNSELVAYVKAWVDQEYEGGRVTALTDEELLKVIDEACQACNYKLGAQGEHYVKE